MNYWLRVSVPAGQNSIVVNQSITTANFSTLWILAKGSSVYTSTCGNVKSTVTQSGTTGASGTFSINWTAAAAGNYYIVLKLDSRNIKGKAVPAPAIVHFDFGSTSASGSTVGIDMSPAAGLAALYPAPWQDANTGLMGMLNLELDRYAENPIDPGSLWYWRFDRWRSPFQ